MPILEGTSVKFADDKEIKQALGFDMVEEKGRWRIPTGYLSLSNNVNIPVYFDSSFLIGPEGAHLNVSGISGLATKTSYIMFLLQSISQKAKDKNIATIIFNVKGDDLLYLDEKNNDLTQSDINNWKKCELEPNAFDNVSYFYPVV